MQVGTFDHAVYPLQTIVIKVREAMPISKVAVVQANPGVHFFA
jgi:hypothetical protein